MPSDLPVAGESFVSDYIHFTEALLGPDGSDAEAALIASSLPPPPARVVDVGAGYGRISRRLVRAGYSVVGIEMNPHMVRCAQEWDLREDAAIEYIHADARSVRLEGLADAAICWFTTFGVFDDEENQRLLNNVYAMVRPGGRFLIDVIDRDYFLNSVETWSVIEVNDDFLIERHSYDEAAKRVDAKQTIIRNGVRRYDFSLRLYDPSELTACLARAGFAQIETIGRAPATDEPRARVQLACTRA